MRNFFSLFLQILLEKRELYIYISCIRFINVFYTSRYFLTFCDFVHHCKWKYNVIERISNSFRHTSFLPYITYLHYDWILILIKNYICFSYNILLQCIRVISTRVISITHLTSQSKFKIFKKFLWSLTTVLLFIKIRGSFELQPCSMVGFICILAVGVLGRLSKEMLTEKWNSLRNLVTCHHIFLFIDPFFRRMCPVNHSLLVKPQINFFFSWFNRIRTMDNIASDLYAKIATNCAWCGIFRICLAQHYATSLHDIQAFPDLKAISQIDPYKLYIF